MTLDEWLTTSGVSATELSRRCGVHWATIYKWRTGENVPRPAQMAALAKATAGAVTASDFYGSAPTAPVERASGLAEPQVSLFPEARALGFDPDAVAEKALRAAIGEEKARRWTEENREAIEAHARWIEENGLPLDEYRLF